MDGYTDKMGLFEDFNFKLVVIEALLGQQPAFEEDLNKIVETYADAYEWYTDAGPIKEVLEFISNLVIEQDDLDKITELCFDGGSQVYHYIQPDWDGEDEIFDVQSVKGFEHLKNLETVEYISMTDEDVLEPMEASGIEIE